MRFCISFGIIDLRYLIYCILHLIVGIFFYLFIFYANTDTDKNIIYKYKLLNISSLKIGYLLNIIPLWISNKKSNNNEYLSIKEVITFLFLSIISLLIEFLRIIEEIIKKDNENEYEDKFIFIFFESVIN